MSQDDISALLAREAIRDLPVRYCDCVWRDDIDSIVKLFADDGSFTAVFNGKETSVQGQQALQAFFVAGLSIQPRPYIHNHVVDLVDTNSATGRCYLDLYSARNNMSQLGAGYYEDVYSRIGAAWKFQSRRFVALRMDELPDGFED